MSDNKGAAPAVKTITPAEMLANMVVPGAVWLTTGFKGGGKSHTAIAVCENLVKGRYPGIGRVVLLTNILFYHKVQGKLKVETPENV
ncbi:MAG: hypothetical protein Q4Q58_07070, partial [Thermoplasmata archaeon]|nr:hypothetical protein [Thermoplasmata archaeon]